MSWSGRDSRLGRAAQSMRGERRGRNGGKVTSSLGRIQEPVTTGPGQVALGQTGLSSHLSVLRASPQEANPLRAGAWAPAATAGTAAGTHVEVLGRGA